MSGLAALGIPLLIGAMFIINTQNNKEVTYVTSNVDGNKYLVRDLPDQQQSADILAQVAQRLQKLVDNLSMNRDKYPEFSKAIDLMSKRYNPNNITEGGLRHDFTTYTVNKGEEISFCLRTRNTDNSLHDLNLIMFVALHELAHIASVQDDPGHKTKEFKDNFRFIVKKAVEMGVWQYTDFRSSPRMYCGTLVNTVPV